MPAKISYIDDKFIINCNLNVESAWRNFNEIIKLIYKNYDTFILIDNCI